MSAISSCSNTPAAQFRKDLIKDIDTNKNGKIEPAELAEASKKRHAGQTPPNGTAVSPDADHNGIVSEEEQRAFLELMAEKKSGMQSKPDSYDSSGRARLDSGPFTFDSIA